jgi:amino acid transporter
MARDRMLPFSGGLGKVNARTGTPIRPAVLVGLLAAALLVLNVGNAQLFVALASICIMLLYVAYLMVTVPLLLRRMKGWPHGADAAGPTDSLFSLGRWGVLVNSVAVVWGAAMAVNLGWPRATVFGTPWYLHWFPVLFLAGAAAVGTVAYLEQREQKRRAEQRARGTDEVVIVNGAVWFGGGA